MNVFDLSAKLSLDKGTYESDLSSAGNSTSAFADKVSQIATVATAFAVIKTAVKAVVSATQELYDSIQEVAEYGDSVDKASQKVGMSTKAYQQWDYALSLAGTSMSECTIGMKTLTNQIDEAKGGSETAINNFSRLGISINDIFSMSREEMFGAVIMGLQNMGESTERASIANDLFGKSGQNLTPIFNMTNDQLREVMVTASQYGMVMSEENVSASARFVDSQNTLQRTLQGVKNTILSNFLPALTKVNEGLAKMFSGVDVQGGKAQFKEGIEDFVKIARDILPDLLQTGVEMMAMIVDGLSESIETISPVIAELVYFVTEVLERNADVLAECVIKIGKAVGKALLASIKASIEAKKNEIFGTVTSFGEDIGSKASTSMGSGVSATPFQTAISTVMWAVEKANPAQTVAQKIGNAFGTALGKDFKNSGVIDSIKNTVSLIGTSVSDGFSNLANNAKNNFNELATGASNSMNSLKSTVQQVASNLANHFSSIQNNVASSLSNAVSSVKTFADKLSTYGANVKSTASKIGDSFMNVPTQIQGYLNTASSSVKTFVTNISDSFSNIPTNIQNYLSTASSNISNFASNISTTVSNIQTKANDIGNAFSNLPNTIYSYMSSAQNYIDNFATNISGKISSIQTTANSIGNAFSSLPSTIKGYFDSVVSNFSVITNGLSNLVTSISTYVSNIVTAFTNLPSQIADIGRNAIQGFADGFTSKMNSVLNSIRNFIDNIKDMCTLTLQIHSPSRWFRWVGEMVVAGLAQGLEGMGDTADQPINNFKNKFTGLSADIDSITAPAYGTTGYGNSSNGVVYNQTININKEVSTADELARAIRTESRYGLMKGVAIG